MSPSRPSENISDGESPLSPLRLGVGGNSPVSAFSFYSPVVLGDGPPTPMAPQGRDRGVMPPMEGRVLFSPLPSVGQFRGVSDTPTTAPDGASDLDSDMEDESVGDVATVEPGGTDGLQDITENLSRVLHLAHVNMTDAAIVYDFLRSHVAVLGERSTRAGFLPMSPTEYHVYQGMFELFEARVSVMKQAFEILGNSIEEFYN